MIDEWIWGTVTRISPEAPVPVVAVADHSFTLGGAGNVASNLRALRAGLFLRERSAMTRSACKSAACCKSSKWTMRESSR